MSWYITCNPSLLSFFLYCSLPLNTNHGTKFCVLSPLTHYTLTHIFTSTYMCLNNIQVWSIPNNDGIIDEFILCYISEIYLHSHRLCYCFSLLGIFILCGFACLFSYWWDLSYINVSTVVTTEATNPLMCAPSSSWQGDP